MLSFAAFATLPTTYAAAAGTEIQPEDFERIFGKWFITSFEIAPIAAVSTEEANAMVGQIAYFNREMVQFGSRKCPKPVFRGATPLSPGVTIDIDIDCPGGEIVPNLLFNRESGQLIAVLDGASYRLGREPPKPVPR